MPDTDHSPGTLGVIVAGGRGARLGGGAPKALVPLAGRTLLERAIATIESACDTWVVTAPAALALPVPSARRVDDVADAVGPLAGVVAALRARAHVRAIVLAVDVPLVTGTMLLALASRLGTHDAVLPSSEGVAQPLVAVYGAAAAPAFDRVLRAGERSIATATRALDALVLDEAATAAIFGDGALLNVNTPGDLACAEARLRAGDDARASARGGGR